MVSASSPSRADAGSDDASTRPPAANAISVPVTALNCTARRSSRKNPTVIRPIVSVGSSPCRIGTLTICSSPRVWGIDSVTSSTDWGGAATARSSASLSVPDAASSAPWGERSTSASASICARYWSASGWTVGASPVETAALSLGRSAMRRVNVVNVSVKMARR